MKQPPKSERPAKVRAVKEPKPPDHIDDLAEVIWLGMKSTTAFAYPSYRHVQIGTREALRSAAKSVVAYLKGLRITPKARPRNGK